MSTNARAARLVPGAAAMLADAAVTVVQMINSEDVIVRDGSGRLSAEKAERLAPLSKPDDLSRLDLQVIDERKWKQAEEALAIIGPLLAIPAGQRTRADVIKVAEAHGRDPATLYRWIDNYAASGHLTALMRKVRKDAGTRRLSADVEAVIKEVIDKFYLKDQRRTPGSIADDVRKECLRKGLEPPSASAVRERIYAIPEEIKTLHRLGEKAARERFCPLQGHFPGADAPLSVVQIDHTPMDVIIVDDVHRKPIRRPYLTIAIDVHTKMALGFYITLEAPSALSTGMCLSRAILGKEKLLAEWNLSDLSWPCWGVMAKVHSDNGKDFRSNMLKVACKQRGFMLERRPKGRPNYGGHVERAFRTFMQKLHEELPGTTFSNVHQRLDYDSDGKAVMTLDALDRWFAMFILGVYHQQPHKGNDGLPPIVKWERGIVGSGDLPGIGMPMRVVDEEKLRLDFMPYHELSVQEYGLQAGVQYWSDALRPLIHSKDPKHPKETQKFICRYDPRDLSQLWLFEPKKREYLRVPYRDLRRQSISLWELKAAKKLLAKESKDSTNEELIFRTIDRMRNLVTEEAGLTVTARRTEQRQKAWKKAQAKNKTSAPVKPASAPAGRPLDDDDELIEPIAGIREY